MIPTSNGKHPIGVLGENYTSTEKWLRIEKNIVHCILSQKRFWDENGQEYIIFLEADKDNLRSYLLSGYIKAPWFETIEDIAKFRIQMGTRYR